MERVRFLSGNLGSNPRHCSVFQSISVLSVKYARLTVLEDKSSVQVACIQQYSVFPFTIPQEIGLQGDTPNVINSQFPAPQSEVKECNLASL